jgi:uncharacterized membrane protein YbhN (UPF0104 family)
MQKKHIYLLLKLLLIAAAFALVFTRIDVAKFREHLQHVNPVALLLAVVFMVLAQIISALRTRYYFSTAGLTFNYRFANAICFVGMMFNNLLPGGVGGDGYKVFLIGRLAQFPRLSAVRLLISDRANGLFVLLIVAATAAAIGHVPAKFPYGELLFLIAVLILLPGYLISIKLILRESPQTALGAFRYSACVQLLGACLVITLIAGLGVPLGNVELIAQYLALFSLAIVASIVPISVGGIGLREVVMTFGASYIGLDPALGVALALLYFFLTIIVSLVGILFLHQLDYLYHLPPTKGEADASIANP